MLRRKIGTGLRRKKPRSKKLTTTIARDHAWKWFSRFIRLRDSEPNGTARCVTCGRVSPIKGTGAIHAGHFVAGRSNAVLYDERNCHAQCFHCNLYNSGSWVEYERFILQKYGAAECDRLKSLRFIVKPMSAEEHEEVSEVYRKKVEELGGWSE